MAVRCGALSLGAQGNIYLEHNHWQGSLAYRWLHSDRHFVGRQEQPQRQDLDTQVENDVHTFDLTATYAVTDRLSLALTFPFVHADRSSLYEHDRTNRHTMSAGGLGDIRLVGSYWLLDPKRFTNGNIAIGLGLKAPTGDYQATDYAHRPDGAVLRPVDQSIQPGDGGWGFLLEAAGFLKLYQNLYGYMNGTYLFNPRNINGVETTTSRPGNVTYMSVPDAYLARAGLSYAIWPSKGLSLTLGGRIEGVPSTDAIGKSEGFRRPGYAISIEPGIAWSYEKWNISVTAPVAVERNRVRSYLDKQRGTHGDAAFADYLITGQVAYRF